MKIQSLPLSLALAATAVLYATSLFVISRWIANSLWLASTRTSWRVEGLETLFQAATHIPIRQPILLKACERREATGNRKKGEP